ncbi:protein SEMI-ROLLED LEAF 2 isoform X2 [Andrographis paniculata]|uniref:protein SEMI-ROLLED LEAF 2 isoform X2 n=1 Tax=Andrographis paniculata TaxID=175694 RepID=UPI0021E8F5AF|nr:protein SEMI-ROLLED LEAF 2 isoform X2 [Andrographis paniculata]
MGVISRKIFPACESMCVCCPALRSRSRQPVKRYKKLLSDIFPKSPDGQYNDRKIVKLCEYASKNPIRIPKIAKYLEDRCYKELRMGNIKLVGIVAEAYNKLLCICKEQMAYFSVNLLNVVAELLDDSKQDSALRIGCDTLTTFIYCQVDGTYTRNIENFVGRVCMLACKNEDEICGLRAAVLRCLSAMLWFMAEISHVFADFEKIVHATLDNYEKEAQSEEDDERRDAHHNWVDEVARCEGRCTPGIADEFSPSDMVVRIRRERKDPSLLTREEMEMPKVLAQVCLQRMVDLAKETTTMRRVLEPVFVYYDIGKHWDPQHGLAPIVLSDMLSFVENPGYQQFVVAGVVRHLDHKNVAHDVQVKCHIIQTASCLARQIRSESIISDVGFVSDLFRHLRRSFQATGESVGEQELNVMLQTSIETCLLETVRGIVDVRPLFDMMAITLEKLSPMKVVAQAALASLVILAHVISVASVSFCKQQVFPDVLFIQIMKTMLNSDGEIRVGAHQIFCILLIPSFAHTRNDSSYHQRKWHSKSASTFSSITALLEKLRLEIYGTPAKQGSEKDDCLQPNKVEDERKHGRSNKSSPNMHIISSLVDRVHGPAENEQYFLRCNEDQIAQLLSALWIQVHLPDNLPANIEAMAHSFCLALISSRLKEPNDSLLRFFQLPLSIRKMSLESNNGSLHPAYQRLLHVLSTAMLVFAAKMYHISETQELLNLLLESDVDPYIGINDDLQVYMKPQAEVKEYGSASDNEAAFSALVGLREKALESDRIVFSMLVEGLSMITKIEPEEVDNKLSEGFVPDEAFLFGPELMLDMDHIQRAAHSKQSQSFDAEFSANSIIEDDAASISSVTDISRFIPKAPASASPSMSHIVSIGQLLESALEVAGQVAGTTVTTSPLPYSTMTHQCEAFGTDTRKKLSNWLIYDNHSTKANNNDPSLESHGKMPNGELALPASANSWLALRLPPASPFDNFLRAARG